MAGRRLRQTVLNVLVQQGFANEKTVIVIAGLSNSYSHYVTTYEEYAVQRYEGASTLFGPHTLAAYQQEYSRLATALATGKTVEPGPTPVDISTCTFNFHPGVVVDSHPTGLNFGAVATQPKPTYSRGQTVQVVFWSGHPNNNYQLIKSFLVVQYHDDKTGQTRDVADDSSPETTYTWQRIGTAESQATITWTIPQDAALGKYTISHSGYNRLITQELDAYTGTSNSFTVQ
jgi:neutral ceramidase